jgi:membrane-bound lytic murein transglycosylase A
LFITLKIPLKLLLLFLPLFLLGCFTFQKHDAASPKEALRMIRFFYPTFDDDMDTDSLVLATKRNLEYLNRLDPEEIFIYGPHEFTCRQVIESQEAFLSLISQNLDPKQLNKEITKRFRVYHSTGGSWRRRVLFTGYFEPLFEASLKPTKVFRYPIYRKPDDLIQIDLSQFNEKYTGESIVARISGKKILPYYSRREIDAGNALKGRNLEIAWLKDPLDVTFLHIQGSGRLRLQNGKTILVGYKAKNGWPYRSIGKYLVENQLMDIADVSMQSIRRYLYENPEITDDVLNYNPSYVFFHVLEDSPLGNINVPVTPGRTIALDQRLFPKGALAFIRSHKPIVNEQGDIIEWTRFSRFVLNQDTGGAIKGPGRADLFWGSGTYAEISAGHMRHEGELFILIKKP